MMDRSKFYTHLRKRGVSTFGTSLSQGQVGGMEAILDAGQGYPLSWVAYALATARGEVGPSMQPKSENLNYSALRIPQVFSAARRQGVPVSALARKPKILANTVYGGAWGKKNLGNSQEGDGWRYRGRGYPQVTGRRNYEKLAAVTGLDLVGNPDQVMKPEIAASVTLFHAMDHGIYTGKAFRDYLVEDMATVAQYKEARRIINGQFHAAKIARFALDFQDALAASGYQPIPVEIPADPPPSIPQVAQDEAEAKPIGFWAAIIGIIFGRKGQS